MYAQVQTQADQKTRPKSRGSESKENNMPKHKEKRIMDEGGWHYGEKEKTQGT